MATVPGQLIWEIVKKNNSFLVKEFGRGNAKVQFSKESNNLYNLNSFKHSGTVHFFTERKKKLYFPISVYLTL
jgi:hypothetical protein